MPQDLPLLAPGDDFPPVTAAWGEAEGAAGLLALGGDLSVATLSRAYRLGIFPWFSAGEPILWWSPDPRMVLPVADFKLHKSLRKTLQKFLAHGGCEIRIDSAFSQVLANCANVARAGQSGTWIVPAMQAAYARMHAAGLAHSVEVWVDDELLGGLYCTAIGQAVFGESMFSHASDASKIALAALVALCRAQGVVLIDCQQNTQHLASLGAYPSSREKFCAHVAHASEQPPLHWQGDKMLLHSLLIADS